MAEVNLSLPTELNEHQTAPNPFIRDKETGLILPLGVPLRAMLNMIADLKEALGAEHVSVATEEEQVAGDVFHGEGGGAGKYVDGHDLVPGEDKFASSVVVQPGCTEDVQKIVRLANKHLVPISPISRGKNLGYGGRAPRLSGSIIIDLGARMNKVLELNDECFYAVVEPGVSYFELHEELVKRGMRDKMWIDCPDLGWGSVLGNMMDRGVGYTPYGDHFSMHCGMELVLPNGEVYHTGMGAMGKDNASRYLFQTGYGPYMDGIFTQSNFGICTSVGMWLMPNPGGYRSYLWTFEKEEDLPQIVELMRPLRVAGVFGHVSQLRHSLVDIACLGDKEYYFPGKKDNLTEEEFVHFIKTRFKQQGYWNYYGAVYGPKEIQDCQLAVIKSQFGKVPGAKLYFVEDLIEPSLLHHRDVTMQGIPNNAELKWLDWRGKGYGHLFFAPISPPRGEDAVKQYRLCKGLVEEYGFQYLGNFCVGSREMHHIVDLIYDVNSADEKSRAQQLFRRLIKESAEHGWGEYRTHIALMDQVAATYGANDQIQLRFAEALKDAIDKNGVLAPGKSGIWPKRYRNVPGIRLGVAPEDCPKTGLWPETNPARL